MSMTKEYGFTPEQIGKLTRVQLFIYSGAIDGAKGREKMLYSAASKGFLKNDRGLT